MKKIFIIGVIIVLVGTSFFSGCVETGSKGIIRLQITDKPGDLKIIEANVNISMVQVHKSSDNEEEVVEYENFNEYGDDFIAEAEGPYEADVKEDIQFLGDAEGGITPYNWSWDFGDGNISYEEDPLYNYSNEGLYIVNLTVTDEDGAGVIDWYVTTAKIGDDDNSEAGWYTIFEGPQTHDLIEIQDVNVLLGEEILDEGKYTQIRLTINSANITIDNESKHEVYDLKIPSNKIKLIKPFLIYKDKITVLTLDFDVNESVHKTGKDKYIMRPTIKVIHEYLE